MCMRIHTRNYKKKTSSSKANYIHTYIHVCIHNQELQKENELLKSKLVQDFGCSQEQVDSWSTATATAIATGPGVNSHEHIVLAHDAQQARMHMDACMAEVDENERGMPISRGSTDSEESNLSGISRCVCMCVCVYVYEGMYVCICMYVCMYIYIYIYMYTHK